MMMINLPKKNDRDSHVEFAMKLRQLLFLVGTDCLIIGDTKISFYSHETPSGYYWRLTYIQSHPTKSGTNEFVEIDYIGESGQGVYYTDMRRTYRLSYVGYGYF